MRPAAAKIRDWRNDADLYVREDLKVQPDKWQTGALNAFSSKDPDKQQIALKACVGPGKTTVLSWMGLNFLSCFGDKIDRPKGAAVAVTRDNLKDNLWPEFSKWIKVSSFLDNQFEWTKERIYQKDHPEDWFMSARSFSKDADPLAQGRTLSGLHSKYVLGLLDESGEIPLPVIKTAKQMLSRCVFGKLIQAGNPSSLDGALYDACENGGWYVITITGDPDDPKRSPRIDINWARKQIEDYGRDDPWVMYSVLGLFPPSSINSLLGIEDVNRAFERAYSMTDIRCSQKRLGIDVAREGDDRTVIFPRQGLVAFNPVIMRGADGPQIAARVAVSKDRWKSEVEYLDCTGGFGDSAYDSLVMGGHTPVRVHYSEKAPKEGFQNMRAYMFWQMAQWIKTRGALPHVPEMVKELTAPTYTFQNGRILLEPKKEIKKRIGRSPDLADALGLTFAVPDMPAADSIEGGNYGELEHDYDPLRD